jgi:hypothetical protein
MSPIGVREINKQRGGKKMKHKLLTALGPIILGLVVFVAIPAMAGPPTGPYYAVPSWDQTFPASMRFIVLTNMSSEAVLDRETGLVWEKSPSTSTSNWEDAQRLCNSLTTGRRLGWRLPTIQELASLVDTSVPSPGPTLPSGHPFSNVQPSNYWSATTIAGNTSFAWGVNFYYGVVATVDGPGQVNKDFPQNYRWCVRGGQGVDPQ